MNVKKTIKHNFQSKPAKDNKKCTSYVTLRDYIKIIIKRRRLVLAILLLSFFVGTGITIFMPKVYMASEILMLPKIEVDKYLDIVQELEEKLRAGVYNSEVRKRLGINKSFDFKVEGSKKGGFLKIRLELSQKEIDQGIKALSLLCKILEKEYEPLLGIRKKEIEDLIFFKKNQIKRKESKINTLKSKIKTIEMQMNTLEEELKHTNLNIDKLLQQRQNFEKAQEEIDEISYLLYSLNLQQAMIYFNQLNSQLSSLKLKKEELQLKIENLDNDIYNLNREIQILQTKKSLIQNIKQIQSPEISLNPIRPRIKENILVSVILGGVLGVFIAFLKELWEEDLGSGKNREKEV